MHFISGLPRSGSTLLSALLRQNPRFQASVFSGLAHLLAANIHVMGAGSETSVVIGDKKRSRILHGLGQSYYADESAEVVFDTNRMWTTKMPLINELYPQAKVIACVRDVSWVMDSLERLYQKTPFESTRLFAFDEARTSVYSRIEGLGLQTNLVGHAWAGLKEAFYGEHAHKMLVVDYNFLAQAPEKVLRLIYQFIDEPWFEGHNYSNVEFQAEELDQFLGVEGMHTVAPEVAFKPRRSILPPDLFNKFQGMDFWKDVNGSGASVIAPQQAVDATSHTPGTPLTAAEGS